MPRVGNAVLDNTCRVLFFAGVAVCVCLNGVQLASAQSASRRFSVEDDIALTQLSRTVSAGSSASLISLSPDRRYFLVLADRGRLDINKAESSIRLYSVVDVVDFLSHPERPGEPFPVWSVTRSTYKYGPIFDDVRWLPDSSGTVFLGKTTSGNHQLLLADAKHGMIQALTPEDDDVTGFDVRDHKNYVYSALSASILQKARDDLQGSVINGTGRSLYELLFPGQNTRNLVLHDRSDLWAVIEGKRLQVVDNSSKRRVSIHRAGQVALALSPNGHSLLTAFTVGEAPMGWESWFPGRSPADSYKLRARHQNPGFPEKLSGYGDLSQYVLIDLYTGESKPLVEGPIGLALGWSGAIHADWSTDGQAIVLSNTFLPPTKRGLPPQSNRPCVVVVDFLRETSACVDSRNDSVEVGWKRVVDVRFCHGRKDVVDVTYALHRDDLQPKRFIQQPDGSWNAEPGSEPPRDDGGLEVLIKEDINQPPLLIATDRKTSVSRVVWDPNPQLKSVKLGEASVLKWKDGAGRDWMGGLYKPPDYVRGNRYPLVIQAHAFTDHQFLPSGSYPTAFAAQELASFGFIVLQVENCPLRLTSEESACQVAGYEGAVERLTNDGLIDPARLGIVGFSRSCYYVLAALTTSKLKFKAALIADGVTFGYSQYVENSDLIGNSFAREADMIIGTSPFGAGINRWLAQSPLFNLEKVITPIEVESTSLGASILGVWEPYAVLRYMHKPVDLEIINSEEHVFTNPANRLISQGNTVDWFRFWLKEEEDQNSTKAAQYYRWRELRILQENQNSAENH